MEKQTLGEKTAEKLLDMIHERGYTAGDKLPTEMELCQLLGAGRNTVREALRILVSRNIVTIRQGAGTFISEKNGIPDDPLGFAMMEDRRKLTRDLLQIRVMLEPPIAALAAQNADEEDIKKLDLQPQYGDVQPGTGDNGGSPDFCQHRPGNGIRADPGLPPRNLPGYPGEKGSGSPGGHDLPFDVQSEPVYGRGKGRFITRFPRAGFPVWGLPFYRGEWFRFH